MLFIYLFTCETSTFIFQNTAEWLMMSDSDICSYIKREDKASVYDEH